MENQELKKPSVNQIYEAWSQDKYNPERNTELIHEIQPWVDHAIIAAGGSPQNKTLRAKANMMAIAYMHRYDPKTSNIKNYLYGQLMGLNRVIGNDRNIIQVPERVVIGRKAISDAENELLDELGRAPSTQEIADRTGIPIKTITKWRQASVPMTEGLLDKAMENQNYAQANIIGQDKAEDAWEEYVYDSLPARTQAIMERLYGMHGIKRKSATEIAKELKISNAAISQHKKRIDAMLNDDSRYDLFGD